jgi:hypothetical protein
MSGLPTNSFHSTHSSISPFSLQDHPLIKVVKINKSVLSPLLYNWNPRAILHRDRSSDSHPTPNSKDSEPQTVLINDWIQMKIDIPKILYANMLASIFTWLLLAGFIILPATFALIRNSHALDGMGKAGKVVISAAQNIPLL